MTNTINTAELSRALALRRGLRWVLSGSVAPALHPDPMPRRPHVAIHSTPIASFHGVDDEPRRVVIIDGVRHSVPISMVDWVIADAVRRDATVYVPAWDRRNDVRRW